MYGFGSDLAAQCLMARVRDDPNTMLMNEWGFFFEETTASSLVKVRKGGRERERGESDKVRESESERASERERACESE